MANVLARDLFYELPGWAVVGIASSQIRPESTENINATHVESPDMRQE